ncbi:toxic anion resistance protein [Bacillus sp. CLL-7-23]|uniref:Toxic anion resistance protein n=1 Tax=Bacillus changyiensis TaxID=3004103 RepID=A0ABT4X7Z7_9BACI|nr:toxic anion resistance protein [Bacillus changyiensis]MDA7028406.1 toxic anion resistance protein [Bacillus changyiensis]
MNGFADWLSNDVSSSDRMRKRVHTLSEEKQLQVFQLAEQIDQTQQLTIDCYGSNVQDNLAHFTDIMLEYVRKNDVAGIGLIVNDFVKMLEAVDPDMLYPKKSQLLFRLIRKSSRSVQETISRYQKTGAQMNRVSVKLEHSKKALLKDLEILEQLLEENKKYNEKLNLYIVAGQLKLEELSTNKADGLRRRLHDLIISREITKQSAMQIQMIQNTNQVLIQKIQSAMITAIPLWKNQVAIALTLLRQQHATTTQQQVSEVLVKNSEILKNNTVQTAKGKDVEIETLKKLQNHLVSVLKETLNIEETGRTKRHQIEGKDV